jgi:ferritin-like metal-binding protein YciE
MKKSNFYKVYLELVHEIYDFENQIVEALPKMIQKASSEELKQGLSDHLKETKQQVVRLEEIFHCLKEPATAKKCKGLAGIIEEGEEILQKPDLTPSVKDSFIIVAAQKVEHYEIASYGSAIALTKHLKTSASEDIDCGKIISLLEKSLDEEGKANKKLTKIAEGNLFSRGVNDEIENEIKAVR